MANTVLPPSLACVCLVHLGYLQNHVIPVKLILGFYRLSKGSLMRDRAFRRWQRQRLMAKRYARSNSFSAWSFPENHDSIQHEAGILARTSKRCSCIHCGNPRHFRRNNDPLQEKVAKQKITDKYQTWLVSTVTDDPAQVKVVAPRLRINSSKCKF